MPCFSTRLIKSWGVYLARADLAKCGLAETKLEAGVWRFVKLHLPPPEMRIFRPIRSLCSKISVLRPRLPASMAHIRPAAPPPTIMTSCLVMWHENTEFAFYKAVTAPYTLGVGYGNYNFYRCCKFALIVFPAAGKGRVFACRTFDRQKGDVRVFHRTDRDP